MPSKATPHLRHPTPPTLVAGVSACPEVLYPPLTQANLSHANLLALQLLCKEPVSLSLLFLQVSPSPLGSSFPYNSVPGPEQNSD